MLSFSEKDGRFSQISTLIVKVTHRCNLDCHYCYEHITKQGEDMSIEIYKSLASKAILNSSKPNLTFLFHGGEPTILKNEWYEETITFTQELAKKHGKKVSFSMQTNLFSVSEDKIALFKKFGIQLGISLDHSVYEKFSSRGGEQKVYKNYLRLKNEGVRCGILSTINHTNYANFEETCTFLQHDAKVKTFKANVMLPVGRAYGEAGMLPEHIHEAEVAILNYMIKTNGALCETNLLTELERYFATEDEQSSLPKTLCHEKTCGAGTSVLGITPKGDILPCGRFQWNDHDYFLGNIEKKEPKSFQEKLSTFHAQVPENYFNCDSCEAKKICRFGCQAFTVRSKEKANIECLPTKMRYAFFKENEVALKNLMQYLPHKLRRVALAADENNLITISSKKIIAYA